MGSYSGAEEFGVIPDMMTVAKQITNGAIPLGAVVVKSEIYDIFVESGGPDYMVEFPHGYTYSAHPVACAAGIAALDLLVREDLVQRVKEMSSFFEESIHTLRSAPFVTDIRNYGFAGGISLEHYPGEPLRRPFELGVKCFEKGYYVRWGGDTVQLAPPFVCTKDQIDSLINAVGESLNELAKS